MHTSQAVSLMGQVSTFGPKDHVQGMAILSRWSIIPNFLVQLRIGQKLMEQGGEWRVWGSGELTIEEGLQRDVSRVTQTHKEQSLKSEIQEEINDL